MFSFNNSEKLSSAYPVMKESIPKSSLGYNTNNKYPEFPPLMNDGRAITASYQPEAIVNEMLIQNNNIQSNWQYRQYLTKNAENIIKYNLQESCNDVGYYKRYDDISKTNVSTPYKYTSHSDNSKPFGYYSSDLKDLYLSREQLNASKVSPVITQEEFIKYVGK
jgi:hypothetical protein